jgi:hypothetical protein
MVKVISHGYSTGKRAAIKAGAGNATGEIPIFMYDTGRLIEKIDTGYNMKAGVGQRDIHESLRRCMGHTLYGKLATLMTGYTIEDLTFAIHAARGRHFRKFHYLLKIRFYYPILSTMVFLCCSLAVDNTPFKVGNLTVDGKNQINLFQDSIRFMVIFLNIGALLSSMQFFLSITHKCAP